MVDPDNVHGPHPALTEFTLDAVAAFQRSVQAGDRIWSVHGA